MTFFFCPLFPFKRTYQLIVYSYCVVLFTPFKRIFFLNDRRNHKTVMTLFTALKKKIKIYFFRWEWKKKILVSVTNWVINHYVLLYELTVGIYYKQIPITFSVTLDISTNWIRNVLTCLCSSIFCFMYVTITPVVWYYLVETIGSRVL